jgi:glutathione S-transferase
MPHINVLVEEQILSPMKDTSYASNQDKIKLAIDEINRAFNIADKHLEGKKHFANDYTFTEVHWIPYLHFCSITGHQNLIDKYPTLKQWFEQMKNRSAYQILPGLEEIKGKSFKNAA